MKRPAEEIADLALRFAEEMADVALSRPGGEFMAQISGTTREQLIETLRYEPRTLVLAVIKYLDEKVPE